MAVAKSAKVPIEKTDREFFVLDCSIVFSWFFHDEANAYADAVAVSMASTKALVPVHWTLEVANTLLVGERRKRSNEAQASSFLNRLSALPIIIDEQTARRSWLSTLSIGRAHGLSSYDAAYLELAIRTRSPIATLDNALKLAAKAVGIKIYKP